MTEPIGERLRQERIRRGLQQKIVAKLVGIHPGALRNIESGNRGGAPRTLEALAAFYDQDGDTLAAIVDEALDRDEVVVERDVPPLAQRLQEERLACGLSQPEAARLVGTRASTIYHVEAGHWSPSGVFLQRLADLYGVTPAQLDPDLRRRSHRPRAIHVGPRRLPQWEDPTFEIVAGRLERSQAS